MNVQCDSKVLFEGIDFTKARGKTEGDGNKEKINKIIIRIDKAHFFSFKDFYTDDLGNCPSIVTDNPTATLSVKLKGKEKIITRYLGCFEKYELIENNFVNIRVEKDWSRKIFPQQLYNLEEKLMK